MSSNKHINVIEVLLLKSALELIITEIKKSKFKNKD